MKLYALDIETDTTVDGLDPHVAAVRSVAVYGDDGALAIDHMNEKVLLENLVDFLAGVERGAVVTWNGSCFDLPFLDTRFKLHGIQAGLVLQLSDDRPPKYQATPGYQGGYRARFGAHDHVDIAYAYRLIAESLRVKWSLKPVSKALGHDPVVVDAAHVDELSVSERLIYNLSDVEMTWRLARGLDVLDLDGPLMAPASS